MRAKRRFVLPEFELCSLALFAALAMGAAPHARAQGFGIGPTSGNPPAKPSPTATASSSASLTATNLVTPASSNAAATATLAPAQAASQPKR